MNLIDSHCHLFFNSLKGDIPRILGESAENGVTRMITVGTDIETSKECIRIASRFSRVYASVGIHPHDAGAADRDYIDSLRKLSKDPNVVALGEMGLDYFRNHSTAAEQMPVFRSQLGLAKDLDLPFIFHNRNADNDVYQALLATGYFNGVAHCFSSNLETARKFLDLGLYISFSGNLTYAKSTLPAVAEYVPLDRLLVETDAPFLSPVPHRGKPNHPGRTIHVAEKLAEIKKTSLEDIAEILTKNTEVLFRLPHLGTSP